MAPNPEETVQKSADAPPMPVERKRIHAEIDNKVDGADSKLDDSVAVKKQKKAEFIIVYSALQWEGQTKIGFGRKNAKKAQEPKEAKDVAAVMEPAGNGLDTNLVNGDDDAPFGNDGFADMVDGHFGNQGFADDGSFGNQGFDDSSFGNAGFAYDTGSKFANDTVDFSSEEEDQLEE